MSNENEEPKNEIAAADPSGRHLFNAWCCLYSAFECQNIDVGCSSAGTHWFCIKQGCCLSATTKPKGCGITTDQSEGSKEICMLECIFAELGLVKPTSCCEGVFSCLCYYQVLSFPCTDDYLQKCVCSYCGLSCVPVCGCCVEPPACRAYDKLRTGEMAPMTMDRGDDDENAAAAAALPPAATAEAHVVAEPSLKKGEDKEMDA